MIIQVTIIAANISVHSQLSMFTLCRVICVDEKVEKLVAVVHGIVAGIPVPFPLPNPNACKDSGLQCPLLSGKGVNYVATLPILDEYPAVSADSVLWWLKF